MFLCFRERYDLIFPFVVSECSPPIFQPAVVWLDAVFGSPTAHQQSRCELCSQNTVSLLHNKSAAVRNGGAALAAEFI